MLSRLRRAATARRDAAPLEGDRGVALLMVIMLSLVVASLGLIVMTAVIQQVRPTAFGQKSTRTVVAAEAGLQAALGQVRTGAAPANGDGQVLGDPAALPCSMSGAVGTDPDLRYGVAIQYFIANPSGRDATWQQANRLTCTPGSGVDRSRGVPNFALLSSSGTDGGVPGFATAAGDRSLVSLYTFNVDDTNTAGGLFYTATQAFCLQAGGTQDGAGITYVPAASCDRKQASQIFVWDTDYRIKLGSSLTSGGTPLCVTGVATTDASAGAAAVLRPCAAATDAAVRNAQLFSYEGGGHFRGQKADNTGYGAACLWSGTSSVGSGSVLRSGGTGSCGANNEDWGSWQPEPRVGAGAAGVATTQIVNFEEFGRCTDVTNGRIDSPYMIVYPCKQDPSGGSQLSWNHKWSYAEGTSAPQDITVTQGGTTSCLTKPGAGADPAFVTFTSACGTAASSFVRVGDTGSYPTSWTFTDAAGQKCLDTGPRRAPSTAGVEYSTIVWATCDGSASQKWNAPVDAESASLTGTRETVRGG